MNLSKLFELSYLSTDAGIYFNRVLFVSYLARHPDPKAAAVRDSCLTFLQTKGRYYVGNIIKANAFYLELGLPKLELPKYPDDYFSWISDFRKNLLSKIEDKTVERWILDYGYYLASISGDIGLLQWSLKLEIEAPNTLSQTKQIKSLMLSAQKAKMLMGGLSLLLGSSDEKFRILWQEWKSLENLLDQLLAFELPHLRDKFQKALDFSEALLAKYRERAEAIIKLL
ncbi:MAG: hypothetical protein MK212_20695 [Saprospiraceae bacterium]|nr:hypothetical protein [Saprospiraceae bacterium]